MYIKSNFSKYISLLFICLNLFAQKPLEIKVKTEKELKIEELREIIQGNPEHVNLSSQHITTEILERIIPDLEQCEYLNLWTNQLTELPDNIGDLENLQRLYLDNNELSSLPDSIGNLTKLTNLYLDNNKLSSLPDSFGKLTKLQYLCLGENMLSYLPESFGSLTKLQYLGLGGNMLSYLPESFGNLTNLQKLDLNNNELSSLPDSVGKLTNLTKLVLFDNKNENGDTISVKIPKTLDRSELEIYGKYEFVDPEDFKPTANIVIILNRGSQRPVCKNQDSTQNDMDDAIQERVPILVSGQILKNYLERKKKIPDIYEIYKLNKSDLYLFLPRGISYKKAFNLNDTTETTVEHLENSLKNSWPNNTGNYVSDNWLDGIKSIFQKDPNYWWNIVLYGHGLAKKYICDLKTKDFKELITFLNSSNINVFFFFYDTCFGGGSTLIEPYKIIKKSIIDIPTLKFMLVSGTTRKVSGFYKKTNYSDLFRQLQNLLNFEKLTKENRKLMGFDPINGLLKIIKKDVVDYKLTTNIPLIKFKNTQFFIPVRKDTQVKVINNVLLKKHKFVFKDGKIKKQITPIKIDKTIKAIFVYPNIIDVPIEIETAALLPAIPQIVSLDPGTTVHCFSKIETEDSHDKLIQNLFFAKEKKGEREIGKIFVVKELVNGSKKYTDIVVDSENNVACYKKDNKFYKITEKESETPIDENTFKEQISEILQKNINLYLKKFPSKEITYIPVAPWKTEPNELISYINNKLNIEIPSKEEFESSEIEKLKKIIQSNPKKVDLHDKEITTKRLEAIIPDLKECKFLNLDHNQLTSLPESFGNLKNLQTLYLSSNQLTSLPESFGNLKNLQTLYLSFNQLTSLPESFGNLKSLQNLSLSFNQLTSLPESFGNLKNLQTLDLSFNQLTSLPESFGNLKNLQTLYLQNNKLSSLPESFDNITSLQSLSLCENTDKNGNTITVKIPKTLDRKGLRIDGKHELVNPEELNPKKKMRLWKIDENDKDNMEVDEDDKDAMEID